MEECILTIRNENLWQTYMEKCGQIVFIWVAVASSFHAWLFNQKKGTSNSTSVQCSSGISNRSIRHEKITVLKKESSEQENVKGKHVKSMKHDTRASSLMFTIPRVGEPMGWAEHLCKVLLDLFYGIFEANFIIKHIKNLSKQNSQHKS